MFPAQAGGALLGEIVSPRWASQGPLGPVDNRGSAAACGVVVPWPQRPGGPGFTFGGGCVWRPLDLRAAGLRSGGPRAAATHGGVP